MQTQVSDLPALYLEDETAWLEASAELIRHGRVDALDFGHLAEYLTDMAIRDRREVQSRLTVLLIHALKWVYQPSSRSSSWEATILAQQDDLTDLVARGVLRNHAIDVLPNAYTRAVRRAASETGLPKTTFPVDCPFTLDQLLLPGLVETNSA